MMKNERTLRVSAAAAATIFRPLSFSATVARVCSTVCALMGEVLLSPSKVVRRFAATSAASAAASFYSAILDVHFSARQAVFLTLAQLSCMPLLFPYEIGGGWRVASLLCLVYALRKSRLLQALLLAADKD